MQTNAKVGLLVPEDKLLFIENVNYYPQLKSNDCGISALIGVAKYWNQNLFIENEQMILNSDKQGYSIGELKLISSDFGLPAISMVGSLRVLQKHLLMNRPIIVPLYMKNRPHFVIVNGFSANRIYFLGGENKQVELKIREFLSNWAPMQFAMLVVTK